MTMIRSPVLGGVAADGAHLTIGHPAIMKIAGGDAVFLIQGKGRGGGKGNAVIGQAHDGVKIQMVFPDEIREAFPDLGIGGK